MNEVVIISGKGGTGKTSLTASFAYLNKNKAIFCDLDVDAPDLHLILQPDYNTKIPFYAGHEAIIRENDCISCGTCEQICSFQAIQKISDTYKVNPIHCEGCKVCVEFCPKNAIDFPQSHCGEWYKSSSKVGTIIHAQLFPGQENSGLLVARLKKEARLLAQEKKLDLILCDGAPGIGCPVIASLSQTNLAVIITEPTPSGVHDLFRIEKLCKHFRVPIAVIINKYDINEKYSDTISEFCKENNHILLAKLPHDKVFTSAMIAQQSVTEFTPESEPAKAIAQAWQTIRQLLTK